MACRACVPARQVPVVVNKNQKFAKPRTKTIIEEHHYYDNRERGGHTRYFPMVFEPEPAEPSVDGYGYGGDRGYEDYYGPGDRYYDDYGPPVGGFGPPPRDYAPYDYYPRSAYLRGARDPYAYDPYGMDPYGYGDYGPRYGGRGYPQRPDYGGGYPRGTVPYMRGRGGSFF